MIGTPTFRHFVPRTLLLVQLALLGASLPSVLSAQQGAWTPPNASPDSLRTLLTSMELTALRPRLAGTPWRELYAGLMSSVLGGVPSDSASSNGRRARATLAKNAAFILLVDRDVDGTTPLDSARRTVLRSMAFRILDELSTDVSAITLTNPGAYDDWQWRSKELIDLLSAYDMLRGTGVEERALAEGRRRLQRFAGNLYREATRSILGFTFFGLVVNNHALMTAAALGTAAVVLNDATSSDPNEQPAQWITTALWHIDDVLWRNPSRQSDRDSLIGYAEGPYYLRYAALNLFPFYRSLFHFLPDTTFSVEVDGVRRDVRHPWYDPGLDSLYRWSLAAALPDGSIAPLEDSYRNTAFPEWALVARAWPPITGGAAALGGQLNSTVDMRANALAAGAPWISFINDARLVSMPEAGLLVLRDISTTGLRDTVISQLTLTARHGEARTAGAGHNQADELSFLLWGGGETMVLDPGYLKYDRRGEVGNAANHNMILVDGAGPAIGSPGTPGGADAYIDYSFSINDPSVPSIATARAYTAYRGATISRTVLKLPNGMWGLIDHAASATPHLYRWQLHGNGLGGGDSVTGTFTGTLDKRRATWRQGLAALHAAVAGDSSMTVDTGSAVHEFRYDSAAHHTVLHASRTSNSAAFASVLRVGIDTSSPSTQSIPLDRGGAVVVAGGGGYRDVLLAVEDTSVRMHYNLTAHVPIGGLLDVQGEGAWLGLQPGSTSDRTVGWMIVHGTYLSFSPQSFHKANPLIKADRPVTLLLLFKEYEGESIRRVGWIDRAATVTLETPFMLGWVEGPNVASTAYTDSGVAVTFNGPGEFITHEVEGLEVRQENGRSVATVGSIVVAPGTVELQLPRTERPDCVMEIIDQLGRRVRHIEVAASENQLLVAGLGSGSYYCRLIKGKGLLAQGRIVVP